MSSGRKKIAEILGMSQKEIMDYLRETDNSLQPTDLVQITSFEHGIKALYYHKDAQKPFKTKVFLKDVESTESLE